MEIGAFEAKNKLDTLLDLVENGEEITITRHGWPVARLVPMAWRSESVEALEALARIRSRTKGLEPRFDWNDIKAGRDSGRP